MLSIQEAASRPKPTPSTTTTTTAAPPSSSSTTTINILPCRIQHNGPAKVTKRYWSPSTESDGSRTAYFRGRKLKGRALDLPSDYAGVVAALSDRELSNQVRAIEATAAAETAPANDAYDDYDDYDDYDNNGSVNGRDIAETATAATATQHEPVKVLDNVASFHDLTVWRHDQVPAPDDPFVRGLHDWISFAHAIHTATPTTT